MPTFAPRLMDRREFTGQLLTLLGDTRFLWLPVSSETTTSTDRSLNARTLTYNATFASQYSALGSGVAASFDGTTDYGSTPDAANLSFGDGTVDSAFTLLMLANITDSAAERALLAKYTTTGAQTEWLWALTSGDKMAVYLNDTSASAQPSRLSDAVVTQGAWKLYGATYSAATGGATAANDITLYEDGRVIASTAANDALYVAMEDTTSVVEVGARTAASFLPGSAGFAAIVAGNLSASNHWAIKELINGYYGLSL